MENLERARHEAQIAAVALARLCEMLAVAAPLRCATLALDALDAARALRNEIESAYQTELEG